jgi:hypothetical protein
MAYKGKFYPRNLSKYLGNPDKIRFLSLWERQLMRWLDSNAAVTQWASEVPIKYVCGTDGREHRYLVDFYILWRTGHKMLVEVKPKRQCSEPKVPKRKTKRYVNECFAYIKNTSKWAAARELCAKNGMIFEIWTEHELRALGLKII